MCKVWKLALASVVITLFVHHGAGAGENPLTDALKKLLQNVVTEQQSGSTFNSAKTEALNAFKRLGFRFGASQNVGNGVQRYIGRVTRLGTFQQAVSIWVLGNDAVKIELEQHLPNSGTNRAIMVQHLEAAQAQITALSLGRIAGASSSADTMDFSTWLRGRNAILKSCTDCATLAWDDVVNLHGLQFRYKFDPKNTIAGLTHFMVLPQVHSKLAARTPRELAGAVAQVAAPRTAAQGSNYGSSPEPASPVYSPTKTTTPSIPVNRDRATLRAVQQHLAELGFNPGPADGLFRGKTRRAIEEYQRTRALVVDGRATPIVVSRLRAEIAQTTAPLALPPPISTQMAGTTPAQAGCTFPEQAGDYCGPSGKRIWSKIWSAVAAEKFLGPFAESCQAHDRCYFAAARRIISSMETRHRMTIAPMSDSLKTEFESLFDQERAICDQKFLVNMELACEKKAELETITKKIIGVFNNCTKNSKVYHSVVVSFGGTAIDQAIDSAVLCPRAQELIEARGSITPLPETGSSVKNETIAVVSSQAHAQLYDDFNAGFIDSNKWFVQQPGDNIIREVKNGRLHLFNQGFGDTRSNGGTSFDGTFLNFSNPNAVTSIETTIEVNDFRGTTCPLNPDPGGIRTALFGTFFNTATPRPGSHMNDVRVEMRLLRSGNSTDPADTLRVDAFVQHCTVANCSALSVLDNLDLGTVRTGEQLRLRMKWDPDNDRFIFQRDGGPSVFSPYTLPDTALPGASGKGFLVASFPPNCTISPQPIAFMDAFFDDVFVNASAFPATAPGKKREKKLETSRAKMRQQQPDLLKRQAQKAENKKQAQKAEKRRLRAAERKVYLQEVEEVNARELERISRIQNRLDSECVKNNPRTTRRLRVSGTSSSDGKILVERMMFCQSLGIIKLLNIEKTDGQSSEVRGIKFYNMFVDMKIEFLKNAWWERPESFLNDRFLATFRNRVKGVSYWDKIGDKDIQRGEKFDLRAKIVFEKTEKGWWGQIAKLRMAQ